MKKIDTIMNKNNRQKSGIYDIVFKENATLKAFFIKGLHRVPNIRTLVLLNDILIE